MRQIYQKKGVTLFALVVTIMIALILMTASIATISNVVSNSRIANFSEEILGLEEQVLLYYLENKTIPTSSALYTKSDILYMVTDDENFEMELNFNGDNSSSGFYKLDFDKIGMTRVDVNAKEDYIIAIPSLHVYKLSGIKANGKTLFSISSKINGSAGIRDNSISVDPNLPTIQIEGELKVKKDTEAWTTKMGITVETLISNSQKLYVNFNSKEVEIATNQGVNNIIKFDSLIDINSSVFNASDMLLFNTLPENEKYITIIKKNASSEVISKIKVGMNNFDTELPVRSNDTLNVTSGREYNNIEFYVSDSLSKVKEVRYEYFTTLDRVDGNTGEVAYYSGDKITREYLMYRGKIAVPDKNGKVTIELPKGISSIKCIIIDNASNMSDAIRLNIATGTSIYYSLNSITDSKVNIKFYGDFSNGSVEYGASPITFTSPISWNNNVSLDINIQNITDKVYLRVKSANETRIIELSIPDEFGNGTRIKEKSTWNNPYIPQGFIHIAGTVETGFIIQDNTNTNSRYNEFVWIPVNEQDVKFERVEFGTGIISSFQNVYITNENSFSETSTLKEEIETSVKTYGGFYVARYEASIGTTSGNNIGIPKSVKYGIPWNNITRLNALESCNLMYNSNTDIKSTLMTASAWDTIMSWLKYLKFNVTESSTHNDEIGNYNNTNIYNTGYLGDYNLNGIWDICGNVSEWTTENYNGSPVSRGGSYGTLTGYHLGTLRETFVVNFVNPTIGFRPIMYIKN